MHLRVGSHVNKLDALDVNLFRQLKQIIFSPGFHVEYGTEQETNIHHCSFTPLPLIVAAFVKVELHALHP